MKYSTKTYQNYSQYNLMPKLLKLPLGCSIKDPPPPPPPPSEKINNTPSPLQTSYTNLNIFWMIPLPSLDGRNFLHWWVMGLKFSKFSREHLTLGMCLQHLHHAPPLTSCTSHWKSPQLQTCIGAVPIYTD